MNILIIRLSSMGDVILASSVFEHLTLSAPGAHIWFVTEKKYAELFENDNRIYKVVGVEKGAEREVIKELQNIVWEKIVDLQNSKKSLLLRNSLKSKQPCGLFQKLHGQRLALLLMRLNKYKHQDHVVARYLKACGCNDVSTYQENYPSAKLYISSNNCDALKLFLPKSSVIRPLIALFPFSAWKNKEWPLRYYGFVGKYFSVKGWNVIIFGGSQDALAARELQLDIGERCISLAGTLSLLENACIIKQCNLALGNDTGLSHMARACGVKTGIIYGPTTWHFGFFPWGEPPFTVFESLTFCRPCHAHGGNVCLLGSRACLGKIHPEQVVSGLLKLYHEKNKEKN